jgi:hypothetical protein
MLEGVRTARGREGKWSVKATRDLLSNRVYLGEARSGEFVTPDAHEALVSAGTFARAQAVTAAGRKGEYRTKKQPHPLSGLVRCASCGRVMKRDSTRRKGVLYWFWRCTGQGVCDSPATIGLPILDGYVEGFYLERLTAGDPWLLIPDLRRPPDNETLETALLEAENELNAYVAATSVVAVGAEVFQEGLVARQNAVQSAREALVAATPQTTLEQPVIPPELANGMRLVDGGMEVRGESIREMWRLFPDSVKRYIYGRIFEPIIVKGGRLPVKEKVDLAIRPAAL